MTTLTNTLTNALFNTPVHPAIIVGLGLAIGLSLTFFVLNLPWLNRPTLEDRIGPYLRTTEAAEKKYHLTAPTGSGIWGLVRQSIAHIVEWVSSRITTDSSVQLRLSKLGQSATVENFRARQLLLVCVGLMVGAAVSSAIIVLRGFNPIVALLLVGLGGLAGHFFNDWWLTQRVKKREQDILAEFPTVAELLALSITAGEGTVDALGRVCRTAKGELSNELRVALAQARTGTSLVDALDAMARRTGIQSLIQFVDGLAVALARGTPLSDVLRAQASDVREEGRLKLMELSGKKEVGMLIPVVLFVLPITVLFAVYPSLAVLNIGM